MRSRGGRPSHSEDSPKVDPLKALVYRGLYEHRDPFGEQAWWIQALAEEGADDPRARRRSLGGDVSAQWAEEARRLKLEAECQGHEIWYRGRRQGHDLLTPEEADEIRDVKGRIVQAIVGPPRSPVRPTSLPQRHWFRVRPAAARPAVEEVFAAHGGGGATGSEQWPSAASLASLGDRDAAWATRLGPPLGAACWRYDFVQEALLAAKGSGLRGCTITQYSPGTRQLKAREGYAEAVSSAGGRELWSPAFLNLLEALRTCWNLTEDDGLECVRLSEDELRRRFPALGFQDERDLVAELRPATIPMPRSLARRLKEAGPPVPPPLPNRLPCRVVYDQDMPWTRLVVKPAARRLSGTASLPTLFGRTSPTRSGRATGGGRW